MNSKINIYIYKRELIMDHQNWKPQIIHKFTPKSVANKTNKPTKKKRHR